MVSYCRRMTSYDWEKRQLINRLNAEAQKPQSVAAVLCHCVKTKTVPVSRSGFDFVGQGRHVATSSDGPERAIPALN